MMVILEESTVLSGRENIKSLYQRKPIVLYEKNFSINQAKNLMRKNLLPVLPILSSKKILNI